MRILTASLMLPLVLCAPSPVDAQQVPRPVRPYRGLFGAGPPPEPTRTRHELTLTASMTGGYDDVITPGDSGVTPGMVPQGGFAGLADGNLRYWFGRAGKSISAEGRGFWNGYTDIDVDPMVGASGLVRAETPLGRRNNFNAALDVAYEPTLILGAFTPLQGDVDPNLLPETGQTTGFAEQRSWWSTSSGAFSRRWTTRQMTNLGFAYARRTYLDELGFDSRTSSGSAGHDWLFSRNTSVRGTYRFSRTSFLDAGDSMHPLSDHTVESGLAHTRRLSPTREFYLAGGGGATYVETFNESNDAPLDYWTPSGYATLRLGVGRSWSVSADYRRGITVLQGVTLESFPTNAASVATYGNLGRRVDLTLQGAYSIGQTGDSASSSRFASYSGLARLRYALARCCAASVDYDYYYYRLQDVANVPLGVPNQFDRNSVRVGFVVWLPLYGSYVDAPERGGVRGRD